GRLGMVEGRVGGMAGVDAVSLGSVTLGLQSAAETGPRAGFVLTARAGVGSDGRLTLDGALSRDFLRVEGAVRAIGVSIEGCGLEDLSMPLPVEASARAVLAALASACGT